MRHHLKKSLRLCLFVVVLTMALLTPALAEAAPLTCGAWSAVKSPNVGGDFPVLGAVAAVSPNDVWAVGDTKRFRQTIIEHWNGTSWSIVSSPNPGKGQNGLGAVATISSNDVWAVGSQATLTSTLVEHWNGARWSIVPSPNPGSLENGLNGIAGISANDIWAVGETANTGDTSQPLIEHWNGSSWSVVPSPNPSSMGGLLSSVAVVSPSDIWAVGLIFSSPQQTLTEHWNGASWSIVSSPNPGSDNNFLNAVATISTNDVWAVGSTIQHWNGISWQVVKNVPTSTSGLSDVTAISTNNVWAVGTKQANHVPFQRTLIEHWDGSSWSIVFSPTLGVGSSLIGVASVAGTSQLWAVGFSFYNHGAQHTLTEFYC